MSGILLLVYDAEDLRCRRLVDWVGRQDRDGRVVTFPYQNSELVRVAPELAGLEFPGEVYTLDLESRVVRGGPAMAPDLLKRLPAWSWARPLARVPWIARLIFGFIRR